MGLGPHSPRWQHGSLPEVGHIVTDGPRSALDQAKKAAGGKDVRVGGGVATIRQCLRQGLVDEAHFAGLDLRALGYQVADTPPECRQRARRPRPCVTRRWLAPCCRAACPALLRRSRRAAVSSRRFPTR